MSEEFQSYHKKDCCFHLPCPDFPKSIRELLMALKSEEVSIILQSGEEEDDLTILGVSGDLLVALSDRSYKFIDISCICKIIICKEEVRELLRKGVLCRNDCLAVPCRMMYSQ